MDRLTMILSVFFMHLPRMHVFLLGKIRKQSTIKMVGFTLNPEYLTFQYKFEL